MRLFISYSRDDKAWVYELWRALRDRAHHDAWIDQRIVPAQDWWETILQNIEKSECFIYVMTPKSVGSIYCEAELAYAFALNKPILPLMLKPCDYPPDLKNKRIQYHTIGDGDSLSDVLFTVTQGLSEVRVNLIQSKYPAPKTAPLRPEEPSPMARPEQSFEVFMMAEEAVTNDNFSLAAKLFQQVITADPKGYGQAAKDRLNEIQSERTRNAEYLQIAQMAENAALLKGARAAWRVFVQKYGDHDPENLGIKLNEPTAAPQEIILEMRDEVLKKMQVEPPPGLTEALAKMGGPPLTKRLSAQAERFDGH